MSKRFVFPPAVLATILFISTTTTVTAFTSNSNHHSSKSFLQSSLLSVSASNQSNNNLFGARIHRHVQSTRCYSSTSSTSSTVLGGVSEFEQWLQTTKDCQYDASSLSHDVFFGSLRGLTFACNENQQLPQPNTKMLQIPQSIVLRSKYDETWDSSLAHQLWNQVQLRDKSNISGYCALLTKGWAGSSDSDTTSYVPPSTAPDAIRHWTTSQKERLNQSNAGRKILELHQTQQDQWKAKYEKNSIKNEMTWEQFVWAMEVVHSRSFRGTFESVSESLPTLIPSIGAPALAAIIGYNFVIKDNPYPNDAALLGLGLVAAIPTLINVMSSSSKESVVLLPMIDSANHLESADSLIELDPVSNCFTLSVGPNCVVMEEDEQQGDGTKPQLYISYGTKKDSELLLNYGFLPGVKTTSPPQDNDDDSSSNDDYRKLLADTFMSRN
mmetsp:Transcript_19044/g.26879  ORF Transcript_19044/g.26879 Transcript_19044/m.26879 type:complete len:440 (-) Transcript_19044:124-1443(-)